MSYYWHAYLANWPSIWLAAWLLVGFWATMNRMDTGKVLQPLTPRNLPSYFIVNALYLWLLWHVGAFHWR